MNKREKEQTISELQKRVEQFKAVVLMNYRGLNVEQMTQLRQRLREEKVSYNVVKNTLMKLASKGTDLEKLNDYFEGPIAMAVSRGDPVPLAKILLEFQKTLPLLEIKAGLVEGKVTSPAEMKVLATLPSREVLMAQVMGTLLTPASQLAGGLVNLIQQLLYVLQTHEEKLTAAEGTKTET